MAAPAQVDADRRDQILNSEPYYASYTVVQAMDRTGIGRSTILEAIRAGDLKARQLGRKKYLILPQDLQDWLESLPLAYPERGAA